MNNKIFIAEDDISICEMMNGYIQAYIKKYCVDI